MRKFPIIFFIIFIFAVQAFSDTSEHIGNIKKVKGLSFIIHNNKQIKAVPGIKIFEGDQIITKENSAVGIIFIDGTVLAIGENSELFLNKYLFKPAKKQYDFDVFLKKGAGIYNSGRLGKLSPESVKVRTPKAIIGIRGTKFFIKVK